jgi:hypothetical protein
MPVTIETSGNNSFPAAQVGDIYYGPNLFGVNLNNEDGYAGWTVPCGPQISNGCYEKPVEGTAEDTGQCTACWRIPDNGLGTNGVRGYMFQLFGSLGGRKETHGVPCGSTGTLAPNGRLSGCNFQNGAVVGSQENEPVFDMRTPNAAIGLPERVDRIGNLSFCFSVNKECSGATSNIENVFIDTYLHRIYQPALYPVGHTGSDGVAGNWGDLNKINENATETWNINFKLCLPEFSSGADPGAQATGGVRINTTPISIDGRQWGAYIKWENFSGNGPDAVRNVNTGRAAHKCLNSFLYISFVPWSAATGQDRGICNADNVCINYDQFLGWVGSQEFKDRVLGQNGQPQVPANRQGSGQQAHWPRWVWDQVGQPRFVVDSPESYVLDGIGIGNEVWFSPTNQEACVCWEGVQFTTDRGTFGKSDRDIIVEPNICTQRVCIDPDDTNPGPTDGCNLCLVVTDTDGNETLNCAEGGKVTLPVTPGVNIFANSGTLSGTLSSTSSAVTGVPVTIAPGARATVVVPAGAVVDFELCCD